MTFKKGNRQAQAGEEMSLPFAVNLSDEMHRKIGQAAADSGLAMHKEIVCRLERSFKETTCASCTCEEKVAAIEKLVEVLYAAKDGWVHPPISEEAWQAQRALV